MRATLYTLQEMVPLHVCQVTKTFFHGLKSYDRLKRGENAVPGVCRATFFKDTFYNFVSRFAIGCVWPSRMMRTTCSLAVAEKNCSRVLNTAVLYKKEVKNRKNQKHRRMQTLFTPGVSALSVYPNIRHRNYSQSKGLNLQMILRCYF